MFDFNVPLQLLLPLETPATGHTRILEAPMPIWATSYKNNCLHFFALEVGFKGSGYRFLWCTQIVLKPELRLNPFPMNTKYF